MGDTRMVAGRSRPTPPRISAAAPGTLTGRPTGVEYRNVHKGKYRFVDERHSVDNTIVLWHNGHRVGRVARDHADRWVRYPFWSYRGRLTEDTAAEALRKWSLQPMAVAA